MKRNRISLLVSIACALAAAGISVCAQAATCMDSRGKTYDCKISNIKKTPAPIAKSAPPHITAPVLVAKQPVKAPVVVAKQPATSLIAAGAKNPSLIDPKAKGNGIVASGGGNIVASGRGNIVASGGGNIISTNGGGIKH